MRHIIGILVIGSLLSSCDYREAVTGNRRGMDYITRDDYRKALQELTEAIEHSPTYCPAYYNRAIAYANLNRPKEALRDMDYVVANMPDNAKAYYNRGIILSLPGHSALPDGRFERSTCRLRPGHRIGTGIQCNLFQSRRHSLQTRAVERRHRKLFPLYQHRPIKRSRLLSPGHRKNEGQQQGGSPPGPRDIQPPRLSEGH